MIVGCGCGCSFSVEYWPQPAPPLLAPHRPLPHRPAIGRLHKFFAELARVRDTCMQVPTPFRSTYLQKPTCCAGR